MILNIPTPNIETSEDFQEKFFSIGDSSIVFDILRNKMYSNPVLAICREITSNARDAHREVGKPDLPIQVVLPNRLESFLKIRDFGPGISPDRMENIFIKYGTSTKRENNVQTGFFGMGAKTPFSYSDTFTIVTNVDGIRYNYACFIDETKVGKLALLDESPTKEPNGTEIIIPVKPADYRSFIDSIELSTRHWSVKPIISGSEMTYTNIVPIINGTNWAIAPSATSWQKEIKLIIDGIEYPLDLNALKEYYDTKMIYAAKGSIYLYFGVGELSLSASREQIYLDKSTKQKICDRLTDIEKEIRNLILAKIDDFTNLWDANVYYRTQLFDAFSNISFLGPLSWKGLALNDRSISISCPVYSFSKGAYSRKLGHDPKKISRSNACRRLSFEKNSKLYVNDLTIKEPTPKHIKKVFEDNPTLEYVQVICPTDKLTEDELNKLINLDKMIPGHLSDITKVSGKTYVTPKNRLILFKFDKSVGTFRQISYSSMEEDTTTNLKVLTRFDKQQAYHAEYKNVTLKNNKILNERSLESLARMFSDVSFYGVDSSIPQDRIAKDLAGFQDLDTFLDQKFDKINKDEYVEMKTAYYQASKINYRNEGLDIKNNFGKLILDPKSPFLVKAQASVRIDALIKQHTKLEMYEIIKGEISNNDVKKYLKDHPEFDIEKLSTECEKKYPLLKGLNFYYYEFDKLVAPIAQYINLIDAI